MGKWIQIWYSWGDQESPIEVPDEADAWEYMAQLAINELRIDVEEKESDVNTILQFSSTMNKVTLYYADGERCYYLITDAEEYNPDEED